MEEVLRASVEFPTIVFTAILAIAAVLWLLSLLGVIDTGVDVVDGALDAATEGASESAGGLFGSDIPVTILLTVFGTVGWFVSVLASIFLLDGRSGTSLVVGAIAIVGVSVLLAIAVASWIGSKLATALVTQVAPSKLDLIGRVAEVRSTTVSDTAGRGEATWSDGTVSTVDIRVVVGSGTEPGELRRGDRALIVDWDEAHDNFYVVHVPPEVAH